MSDYIPIEIQLEIMKKLPVKSLVQFRSVSKQWKSFIDYPEFTKTYHINHPNPQHHLLVGYTLDAVRTYTSIIDDDTFPQQKFLITPPEPLNLLRHAKTVGSVDGLVCFGGWYKDNKMVVLWNPSIRKSVAIPIPNVIDSLCGYTCIGFGVCPHTNDPKLVKINVTKTLSICWEVHVFTLSSRVWKAVYTGAPFKSCHSFWDHVFIDGLIYWHSCGRFLISFDLKREKFGEVCLPDKSAFPSFVSVAKVNESLGLLEFYSEGGLSVCEHRPDLYEVGQAILVYMSKGKHNPSPDKTLLLKGQFDNWKIPGAHKEVWDLLQKLHAVNPEQGYGTI
nr:hypothetical protein [Tanacetum cinerariifolium]